MHAGAYLNEFAIRVPNAAAVHRELLRRGVLAGLVLGEAVPDEPSLADALLVCATEVTTGDDIATFARELGAVLAEAGHGAGAGAGDGTGPVATPAGVPA